VIVFTGGDPVRPSTRHLLPADATVIAADSGVDAALACGRAVDVAVGDFDSVSAARLAQVEASGATIERHPAAKDHTDFEIALDAALRLEPRRIVVVGGYGGRLDHFLANALVLASPRFEHVSVEALMGPARVAVVRDRVELHGTPGELVTLLPVHGPATGVRTGGLLYRLDGEDLPAGTTRGVSNELAEADAWVSLDTGTLLAVQPGAMGTHLTHHLKEPS
jgi:thiamine pyrophosphokinase